MKPIRVILLCAFFALAVMIGPQSAFAEAPPTSPAVIHHEDFDDATMPGLDLDWVNDIVYTPKAYWGRVTQRAYAGSGLWCAGSIPDSPTPSPAPWVAFGGTYPNTTGGLAIFDLPQLSDYYSSSLDYRYTQPSLGSDDSDALNVLWYTAANQNYKDYHYAQPLTAAGVWAQRTYDMSVNGGRVNLSRTAGQLAFNFVDSWDGQFESPTNGEGATIDEVYIRGFKFGPVRSLTATVTAGHVVLTWQAPWRSTDATATEERPVAYRVWRSPDTSPAVWTELTSSRLAAATYDDAAPPSGYVRYAVQAWDTGSGVGYGQLNLPDDSVRIGTGVVPPTTSHTVTPASGNGSNGWYVTTPTVAVTRDLPGAIFSGPYSESTATYVPSTDSPFDLPLRQGDVTYGYFGRGSGGATETLVHPVRVKLDSLSPVTGSDALTTTYTAPASVTLTPADAAPGSGVAGTRFSVDGAAATSGTVVSVTATGTHVVTWSSIDVAGIREETKTATIFVAAPPEATTSVTIKTTATSARIGQIPILSGAVTPVDTVGYNMVVYVMKPGKTYWTYSSNRTVYLLSGKAAWQYKYYFKPGMVKGIYKFKAVMPAYAGHFKTSTSPTTVSIRLY